MKDLCRKIQDTLATDGPQALQRDEASQQHLAECNACYTFLESVSAIEDGMQELPRLDVADHVVESLLSRPELAVPGTPAVETRDRGHVSSFLATWLRPRPLVWSSIAAAFLIVAIGVGLRFQWQTRRADSFPVARQVASSLEEDRERSNEGGDRVDSFRNAVGAEREGTPDRDTLDDLGAEANANARKVAETKDELGAVGRLADEGSGLDKAVAPVFGEDFRRAGEREGQEAADSSRDFKAIVSGVTGGKGDGEASKENLDSIEETERITSIAGRAGNEEAGQTRSGDLRPDAEPESQFPEEPAARTKPASEQRLPAKTEHAEAPPSGPIIAGGYVTQPVLIEDSRVEPTFPEIARVARVEAHLVVQLLIGADGTVTKAEVLTCDRPDMGFEQAALEAVEQWRFEPATTGGKAVAVYKNVVVDFELQGEATPDRGAVRVDDAVRVARAFLDERSAVENVEFVAAGGYWSNTYVPGDPAMRLLEARLAAEDRSALGAARLHDASRRIGQPFDAPEDSALAVYLHADRSGVAGESRMLVQVGLQGTPRHGGRRPAMNLALVVDLGGEITTADVVAIRSLLDAFNEARQPGDRFRVFVAGRPGGLAVEPDDFRHGFLRVMLDRALAANRATGPVLDVVEAVSRAIETVAAADDPDAPLGSSAVCLVARRPFGDTTRTLVDLAHQGAVAGIPLSVVAVGENVDLEEMDLVTLAGQGNRRVLDRPAAATELVDRELSAVSRAIARAVRLRIRLAPGVKLVDVLGSEQLDETRAQRVRDAERSIDLRLARNLGIDADRGEDEEGIQIVIPSFYAGDTHVILLDVVTPGPGPVADVTVRYKDLVHLRNGVTRAGLEVGRDSRPDGPLERNVLKNLLSLRLARTLDAAGRALGASDRARAAALLDGFSMLLVGLGRELPGLASDPAIRQDIAMLGEYHALITSGCAGQPGSCDYLADSLRYAGLLKVRPRPLETWS